MPDYMLLLRHRAGKFSALAPDEVQGIVSKYKAWRDDLARRDLLRGGDKLTDDGGRHLRVQGSGVAVTDGPYSETNEVLGGYFVIQAADYDEAVAIARTCPHLSAADQWIEVRQVDAR